MDLYSMIEAGGRMKFEVTAEDLVAFADRLIAKAQEAKALELAQQRDMDHCKGSFKNVWRVQYNFVAMGTQRLSRPCPCRQS